MSGKKFLIAVVAGMASIALPALAQSEDSGKNEVSVQAFGSFVKSTTDTSAPTPASTNGGVLGSYRRFFSDHSGIEVNYGYALNTQDYLSTNGTVGVRNYSHEISGAYVLRLPLAHFTPFVLAGVGALVFEPNNFQGADLQTRAAGVYGGGADLKISRHVFMRAEYRGFIYDSPTYSLTNLAGADRVTHRAEPSIGFGYRF